MKINLNPISKEFIIRKLTTEEMGKYPLSIQYADFNVLNYFYENNFKPNELSNFYFYPDSTAVFFYIKYILKNNCKKIISTDLQTDLLFELNIIKSKIYLFGDSNSILQQAIKNVNEKHSNINVAGYCNGYKFDTRKLIDEINENQTDILFVGLGVGRQEKWIIENYKKLNVKVILSVGGWFQYLSKNKKRAPLFLRKIHLEWLHKIIVEFPRVWRRYFIGIPKFYYRVITRKIKFNIDEQ